MLRDLHTVEEFGDLLHVAVLLHVERVDHLKEHVTHRPTANAAQRVRLLAQEEAQRLKELATALAPILQATLRTVSGLTPQKVWE